LMITLCISMSLPVTDPMKQTVYEDLDEPEGMAMPLDKNSVKMLILSTVLAFLANGLEAVFGYLIFSYAKLTVPTLHLRDGTWLVAAFWLSFSIGRILCVFISVHLQPYTMIAIDLLGLGLACCCLFIDSWGVTLYLGIFMFGLFLSGIVPSLICFIRCTVRLRASLINVLVIGAAFGELVGPLLVAYLMNELGARIFIVSSFLTTVLMLLLFVAILNRLAQFDKTIASQSHLKQVVWHFLSGETIEEIPIRITRVLSRKRPPSTYRRFTQTASQDQQQETVETVH